jgi:type I restriction enzyme S subunit
VSTTSRVWLAGELGTFRGGSGFPIRHQGKKSGDLPFFKVSDMNSGGNELFMTRANNYISEAQRKTLGAVRMPAQAIVFAKVGAAVFQERKRILAQDSCIDNNMAAFIVDKGKLDVRFAHYLLTAFRMSDLVAVGALPSLNGRQLRSIPLLVPSDLAEQRRIVAALADADDLIATLERLIAKKQAIKQGMMQQLLTGRTRLPGFTGSWSMRKIGDFAEVRAGGTPSTSVSEFWGGEIPWMSSGEIHKKRVFDVNGRITTMGLQKSSAHLFPRRTVLMALAGQGKTRGTVAISHIDLTTNQSIAGIYPSSEHDPDYLYYSLDTRYSELRGESTGDGGRGGLNLTIIKNVEVPFPKVSEQRAIAAVLADVDNEVSALSARLTKARAIKTGMMQQLLTGRVRLPVEAAS